MDFVERERNLQQYKEVFTKTIHWQYPLSNADHKFLANLRRVLNLGEESAQSIEKQVTQGYKQKLGQYEATFTEAIHQQYPLRDEARRPLRQLQQSLNLRQEIIDPVEVQVTQAYEQKLQQYEKAFIKAIQRQYSLSDDDRQFLDDLQRLSPTENQVTQGYERKLQQYEDAYTKAIHQQYPLGEEAHKALQRLQRNLVLGKEITKSIETPVTQVYERKLQQYEATFTRVVQRQHPLRDDNRQSLDNLRQGLNLSEKLTDAIEELDNLRRGLNLNEQVTDSIETKVTATYNLGPSLPATAPQGREHKKIRQLLPKAIVVAVALVGVSVSVSYAYGRWQAVSAKANLERAKTLKEEENYQACINQAKAVLQQSLSTDVQNLLHQCQRLAQDQKWLAQARALATKDNLQQAIAVVSKIGSDSSFHQEAQQLTSQWSENLLKQAQEQSKQPENVIDQKVKPTVERADKPKAASNGQGSETARPTTRQPATQRLATRQSTTRTRQPATQRSTTRQSTTRSQSFTNRQPSTQRLATRQSTTRTRQPATQRSATRRSTTQRSTTRRSTTQRSTTQRSTAQRSTAQKSPTRRPSSGGWPSKGL